LCNNTSATDCNIFIYIGAPPSFNNCASGWQSTGNLIGNTDLRFDTSQLNGGKFYDSYNNAVGLAGSNALLGIQLVVDGGWIAPSGQDILVNNVTVNNFISNNQFCGRPVNSIPTLSEWGMVLMSCVLGLIGFCVLRRKYTDAV